MVDSEVAAPPDTTMMRSHVYNLVRCLELSSRGPRLRIIASLRRAENWAETRRSQARAHVELVHVVAVDEQHGGAHVREVITLFQDAHDQVDRELRLNRRLVTGGDNDRAALDAAIDPGTEVVRDYLGALGEVPLAQHWHRG